LEITGDLTIHGVTRDITRKVETEMKVTIDVQRILRAAAA
jgi:polyisoprenoid-binding protein YceI